MWWSIRVALLLHTAIVLASSLTPPVLPLIVRSPYLSTWLGNARNSPWSKWPIFYTGQEIGFSLMARVPGSGIVYPLLGRPQDFLPADQGFHVRDPYYIGATYDASTTNLTYEIPALEKGYPPLRITASFLSPITPTSTLRQSIPAGYVTVHVNGSFVVDLYIDVNGQWMSGDDGSQITWDLTEITTASDNRLKRWRVKRQTELHFSEIRDRGEWGTLHLMGPASVQHGSGSATQLRRRFAKTGRIDGENDYNFRHIMDNEPVFAFSNRLSFEYESVTFTITLIQQPAVQFAAARGMTQMRPLWKSWFSTDDDMLSFHYGDFVDAGTLAAQYSNQLAADAYNSGARDYVDIVALSARQVLGATVFGGTLENPILFLKEISSNGNFQTIDVIFPSFPFFLYTNPRWLAYLLEPLIEHMSSKQYPNRYAMHDLGTHFPNATGYPDGRDEYMPLEESGNILIMALALVNSLRYADVNLASPQGAAVNTSGHELPDICDPFTLNPLRTVNGIGRQDPGLGNAERGKKLARKWIGGSYPMWKQFADYLVDSALRPENQLSTDDFAGWLPLQTNLALKGIIGIKAMSQLAGVVGKEVDRAYYQAIAEDYISKWEKYGMARDHSHAKVSYDWYGSWTTLYNLYADALLCFHLEELSDPPLLEGSSGQMPLKPLKKGFVPRHIYQKQSIWYHYVRQKYGLPLDSRHLYTKTDWEFFAMAVAHECVRSEILESVAKWINETVTDRPLTDLHDTEGEGGYPGITFFARPVVGGHFAFLALERACSGEAMGGLAFLEDDKCPVSEDHLSLAGSDDWTAAARAATRFHQGRRYVNDAEL